MEIKKYKVIRKTDYESDIYYIKFRRMFFGIIPIWSYLRKGHLREMYKLNRYFIHINILLISWFLIGVRFLGENGVYLYYY